MDKSSFDYLSETVDRLYNKLEDAFTLQFSDEEINEFKEKLEHLNTKLDQMEALNCLIVDVHNEIVDIQQFLANNRPPKDEEEEEKVEGLKHLKVAIPSSDSIPSSATSSTSSATSSTDSIKASKYEKLPFTFLRSISNSAYSRYYTAYKEAKTIHRKLNKEDIFKLAEKRIQTPAPDAKTLYANLQEVFEAFDTIELTKKYGKEFIRFHKIFKRMLHLAKTYASRQK